AALRACGLADYTRASTRITAKLAKPVLALALQIAERAPVLRSVAINVDATGKPVEYGATWFAGDRVTLTVTPDAE
ncbi:MAG: UTRA domain-containing protein, partial [Paracoccaceae bacterium]